MNEDVSPLMTRAILGELNRIMVLGEKSVDCYLPFMKGIGNLIATDFSGEVE